MKSFKEFLINEANTTTYIKNVKTANFRLLRRCSDMFCGELLHTLLFYARTEEIIYLNFSFLMHLKLN